MISPSRGKAVAEYPMGAYLDYVILAKQTDRVEPFLGQVQTDEDLESKDDYHWVTKPRS